MRTSLIALGFLTLGLAHCSGDRGLFVGEDRDGGPGEAGDTGSGGSGAGTTGGNGGTDRGGTGTGGSDNSGGTDRGGTGTGGTGTGGTGTAAEGGEGAEPGTGGTGNGARGGTNTGGGAGDAGSSTIGGTGGSGAEAGMGGVAARGGMNTGGRAGDSNAGAGGRPTDATCTELAREYRERLASAQQCAVAIVEQCSREMPDDLLCGCPTFVNPTRESDIRRMLELIELGKNCVRICPAIACVDVKRGQCGETTSIISARTRCIALP